jgi:uncharacterized membrane protein YoaK (UPF0700 family)
MLKKIKNRALTEQLTLGGTMAFFAGMVNVTAFLAFYVFSSNVTGYYAILGAEIADGNIYQIAIVFTWIFLFLTGSFVSSLIVNHFKRKRKYIAFSIAVSIEILCLFAVGFYGVNFYSETLSETEILVALMLFSMGLQNGMTSSISKFAVKTTHLTGATTDLGVLLAMLTKKSNRKNPNVVGKTKLLAITAISYLMGAVFSGLVYFQIGFYVLYITSFLLLMVLIYNWVKVRKIVLNQWTIYGSPFI